MPIPIATKAAAKSFPARFGREIFSFLRFAMSTVATASMETSTTIAELLRRRALERPDQGAFVFLEEPSGAGQSEQVVWTYADLDRRAGAIAAAISQYATAGDRAVLVFGPGLEVIAAFFGCLYAGVLPVPATYPKPRRRSSRLDSIVADCTPALALTTTGTLGVLELDEQSAEVRHLTWVAVDRLPAGPAPSAPTPRRPEDAAFLQYTSGSTSQPRGVVVTHANLLHNLELIRRGFGLPAAGSGGAPQAGVFWLPAYHDMGLIGGILTPLYVGGTSYLMAPATFLQRPLSWLEAISRTGAAISGAPNFAYELCVRKTTPQQRAALNLSKWQLAFCGAEPIEAATLQEFAAAFTAAGFSEGAFYPCYGLAESTLMVTGGRSSGRLKVLNVSRARLSANELVETRPATPDAQSLVSCGHSLGDQQVRVVNPQTFEPCPEGVVGEIWVQGGSVAAGYWNQPEELWQTFGGRIADGSGPFLRTGDLGAFHDCELYVTGRAKDLIIIRGRNLYPQDVERTAQQAHEAVEAGAAFAVSHNGQEQLVAVHQVGRHHRRDDLAPVLRAIRTAIVEEHEVDPYAIVLLRPGGLPLTSSGKVQRRRCREMFEAAELDELARWSQPTETPAGPLAPEGRHDQPSAGGERSRPDFLNHLAAHTAASLAPLIQAWMLAWLSAHVEATGGELAPDGSFTELGMDSLTALELNIEFEQVLGVRLPPAAAWSYPTPAALSQYLAEVLLGVTSPEAPAPVLDSWFLAMEADAKR
ncbi:MAG: AMP-binding protein [Pirellulales bacterium]|nr:AMP-binding protein [Pirellulales bacterium]